MKRLLKRILTLCLLFALTVPAAARAADAPIRIAFIDSGISTKHIDPARVAQGKNYVFPESDTQDRIGHGTATAGLVLGAAEQGVVGVCPDAVAVPLVVVDVYPSGVVKNGGSPALCQAIRDAVDEYGCRIINISLASLEDSQELRDAAAYAERMGTVIVTAVGNDGENGRICYPAAYETAVSVGAADGRSAAAFSQRGADVLAEGVKLRTATNKSGDAPAVVSGTSYSCAVISGICARICAAYPDISPAETRRGLYALATDILEPGFDAESGWGLVPADTGIPTPYLDVPGKLWSSPAVRYVTERGVMNGTGGGMFTPEGRMTRAMFAAVLYRIAGEPETAGGNPFTDVSDGRWYTDAVIWAAGEGIIGGYGDGRFGADDPVTREQLVTLLWRCIGKPAAEDADLSAFADADQIGDWAADAMAWAVGAGILNGRDGGMLAPKDTAARAEVAALIQRFCEKSGAA